MHRISVLAAMVAAALGCARPDGDAVERGTRVISVGADAAGNVLAVDKHSSMHVLETDGNVAILEFDARYFDELSEMMHEEHHRCGGFMVHDSVADARIAFAPPAERVVEYTIDRPEIVAAILPAIDRRRILATIGELSSRKNRYYQSESGAAASHWLRDRWKSFTTRADVTVELVDHGYKQKSVVMTIPGRTRPDEIVVIGGHLDSIALGGASATAPGADDDASGIATLTEVARALLAADFRPDRTIQFMAYAAEEVGLRGSLSIARDYQKRGVNVVGALQFDMTNFQGSDRDIWIIDDFTSKAQNRFLIDLIEKYVGASWGVDVCGYACSDHASWNRIGVPASMPFESRSKQMNKKIHTRNDTLEQSGNNASHAVKFARLGAAYAIELAKGELLQIASSDVGEDRDKRVAVLGVTAD